MINRKTIFILLAGICALWLTYAAVRLGYLSLSAKKTADAIIEFVTLIAILFTWLKGKHSKLKF